MRILAVLWLVAFLIGWVGQLISAVDFETAQGWGLQEKEGTINAYALLEARSGALWDALVLWVFFLAAIALWRKPKWGAPVIFLSCGMMLYFSGLLLSSHLHMLAYGEGIGLNPVFFFTVFTAHLILALFTFFFVWARREEFG